MTVPNELARSGPYLTNGATTTFPFAFHVLEAADLQVRTVSILGLSAVLPPSAYAVQGLRNPDGGQIVLTSPYPSGFMLYVEREMEFVQNTDLVNQGGYFAEQTEDDFDRSVMRDQQLLLEILDLRKLVEDLLENGIPTGGGDGRSINPRGAWASATPYKPLDLVYVGGSSYVALVDHVSANTFQTDNLAGRWMVSALQGAKGDPGVSEAVVAYLTFSGSTGTVPSNTTIATTAFAFDCRWDGPALSRLVAFAPASEQPGGVTVNLVVGGSTISSWSAANGGQFLNELSVPTSIAAGTPILVQVNAGSSADVQLGTIGGSFGFAT